MNNPLSESDLTYRLGRLRSLAEDIDGIAFSDPDFALTYGYLILDAEQALKEGDFLSARKFVGQIYALLTPHLVGEARRVYAQIMGMGGRNGPALQAAYSLIREAEWSEFTHEVHKAAAGAIGILRKVRWDVAARLEAEIEETHLSGPELPEPPSPVALAFIEAVATSKQSKGKLARTIKSALAI